LSSWQCPASPAVIPIGEEKKNYSSSKKLLTSIKEKGPLEEKHLHQKRNPFG